VTSGSLSEAGRGHRLIATGLIGVIIVSAVVLGLNDVSKPWTIFLQVLSAVAGAALGNFLRLDLTDAVVRNQARPSIRHLYAHVTRLSGLVTLVERRQAELKSSSDGAADAVDPRRVADWFGSVGSELRAGIDSTALAIENWNDLAPDIRLSEFQNFQSRNSRLPESGTGGGEEPS